MTAEKRLLSDLILQGCEGTLQHFDSMFNSRELKHKPEAPFKCCAFGAAVLAVNGKERILESWNLLKDASATVDALWDVIGYNGFETPLDYPADLELPSYIAIQTEHSVTSVIFRLNDNFHWSREQIAAYLKEKGL